MIESQKFVEFLRKQGVDFFAGVPDSLLSPFSAYLFDSCSESEHIIAANEGSACALAMGHHFATGKMPLVYMQNSGLGNAYNPLVSLCSKEVVGIPMLLVLGWRAEVLSGDGEQLKDEPQHREQGRITRESLSLMQIPYEVMSADDDFEEPLMPLLNHMRENSSPAALVVRKSSFAPYKAQNLSIRERPLTREQAIKCLAAHLPAKTPIVATTGKASRELYEYRNQQGEGHQKDFLTVGGMGHASSIACGIALAKPNTKVACIDGDGALLMHMGSVGLLARQSNLFHVVIHNEAHESVGGQPTARGRLDFGALARAAGYAHVVEASREQDIIEATRNASVSDGSFFLLIETNTRSRKDLGRPKESPLQNKRQFMELLHNLKGNET